MAFIPFASPKQDQMDNFPDALGSTGFRYSICRPAVRSVIALLVRLCVWFRKENILVVKYGGLSH